MNTIVTSLLFIFIAIAFVATIISGILKLIFFYRIKDTYKHILKFGLWGEIIGMIILAFIWLIFKNEINNWGQPESIILIPFYSMLIGQVVGFLIALMNFKRRKSAREKIENFE